MGLSVRASIALWLALVMVWRKQQVQVSAFRPSTAPHGSSAASAVGLRAVQEKDQNFRDSEVECTSEGGKWRVPVGSVASKSNLVISERTSFDNIDSWTSVLSLLQELVSMPPTAANIVALCDRLDAPRRKVMLYGPVDASGAVLRFYRSRLLAGLLRRSRQEYTATVEFLQVRIPRNELPNLQQLQPPPAAVSAGEVPDCPLPDKAFDESPLDVLLLGIFRGIVQRETGYKSPVKGIKGLLDEGKTYMLSPEGTPENQHAFVRRTLAQLMTPVLPPFYRIFMSGLVPSQARGDPQWLEESFQKVVGLLPEGPVREKMRPGSQLGPWFYAPALTSVVTPTFLSFLVGPSKPNYRSDGQLGGLVVEKCKFLQESGCKGLCLHQCKLPAQQFFDETLGLSLTVEPNFATQECQWSWGEVPRPHAEDPAFPQGCLAGCPTRQEVSAKGLAISC